MSSCAREDIRTGQKVFVTAMMELMNSGSGRLTGAPPDSRVLTASEFVFSIKRRTENEMDRRRHGVQLIQVEQVDS